MHYVANVLHICEIILHARRSFAKLSCKCYNESEMFWSDLTATSSALRRYHRAPFPDAGRRLLLTVRARKPFR